jgi:hypothetical protein
MADIEQSNAVASWVQAGGVVAFAGAVLLELKQLRPIMSEVKQVLASMLERERMRAEQRAQILQQQGIPENRWDDVTDAVSMPVQKPILKRRSPPRGYPVGNYGPMKPKHGNGDDE